MQDFRTIKDFRKGYKYSQMAEDPTYLSFFFMFDYYTENSPLLNGQATSYLRDVVGDEEKAVHLENFIKILKRVNSEFPWFWQSITGLEKTKQYGKLEEPWFGGDNSVIEIQCLETVELTVSGMFDLYKKAAYDLSRWVEVIPKNYRYFTVHIWVSEIRDFGTSFSKKAIDKVNENVGITTPDFLKDNSVKNVRPFFKVSLSDCVWDIDSTSNIFSDLSRNPEAPAAPVVKFFYNNLSFDGEYANNAIKADKTLGEMIGSIAAEKLGSVVDGAASRLKDKVLARLLLGNVYGVNALSSIQDAVSAGSINGITNLVRGFKNNSPTNTPLGNLGEVYDDVAPKLNTAISSNVYGEIVKEGTDFIKENIHDGPRPTDNEGPINQNVYD